MIAPKRPMFVMTIAVAAATVLMAGPASAVPSPAAGDVFYSSQAIAPQSQSPAAMRTYISTDQSQLNMQSYVWAGSLIDDDGKLNTFALEMQRNDESVYGSPTLPVISAAAMINRKSDPGYIVGGLVGVAELTTPLALTTRPWSARAESLTPGKLPNFIDARVVKGVFGKKGAVYEFTSYVPNGAQGAPAGEMLEVYVRVKDPTGLMMWGYGPSGFFPQWIYPAQRALITGTYGSSVGAYLKATDDPMTNQGDYYYTLPLLQVQRYTVSLNGSVISKGTDGVIWFDTVTQEMDAAAMNVITKGVSWMEFSVQIPKTGEAMKIGYVEQSSVGQLSYAMLHEKNSKKAQNGAFTNSLNWDMDKIHITPVTSSAWTSPESGNTYYTKFTVDLDGKKASRSAHFTMTSKMANQEVNADGRHVYEGLFTLKGTLRGKKVSGQAWAEVQPTLTP